MATLKEVDHTAVNGSEEEPPAQEEDVEDRTPERRHVDALLDISEQAFMKELEPHEYHCYSGWAEAVHGWARVAPLSCILVTEKQPKKPKQKEAGNSSPLSVDPIVKGDAGSADSIAEQNCESHEDQQKNSIPLNQDIGSLGNTTVAATQEAETAALRETILPHHYLPSKHRHPPNRTVVPIRNFTFLPPIKSPQKKVSDLLCIGKKTAEGETKEESCLMFDKKSGTRGTRVVQIDNPQLPADSAAWTFKHSPHLLSVVSVSIPKRCQIPASSKPETVHRPSYSMGQSLTQSLHSSTAAGAQGHMDSSNTACMKYTII